MQRTCQARLAGALALPATKRLAAISEIAAVTGIVATAMIVLLLAPAAEAQETPAAEAAPAAETTAGPEAEATPSEEPVRANDVAEEDALPPGALSPEQIAGVMQCMLPQARGEGWRGEELQARYYQPEQLVSYGRAIRRSVARSGLAERYVAIFIGTLYQQSKFQYDAVSRHNYKDGKRLKPRKDVWRRAQKGMDYGIFQHHWPFHWTPTLPPWDGERKPTLAELKDPLTNILLAGEWFRRKAETCEDLTRKRSSRRACKFDRSSLTCRCLRTKKATGAFWVNANPRSIGRIMRRVDRCIAEVRDQGET